MQDSSRLQSPESKSRIEASITVISRGFEVNNLLSKVAFYTYLTSNLKNIIFNLETQFCVPLFLLSVKSHIVNFDK